MARFKKAEHFGTIMSQKFNILIEKGEDGYLIADVVELPGCHTQAKTHDQLIERIKEAIKLYIRSKKLEGPLPKFVGLQEIEIEA